MWVDERAPPRGKAGHLSKARDQKSFLLSSSPGAGKPWALLQIPREARRQPRPSARAPASLEKLTVRPISGGCQRTRPAERADQQWRRSAESPRRQPGTHVGEEQALAGAGQRLWPSFRPGGRQDVTGPCLRGHCGPGLAMPRAPCPWARCPGCTEPPPCPGHPSHISCLHLLPPRG